MSHLPLDARAILQHLNELGYRNISAEQLREFLKGMQPQSDKQSATKSNLTTARASPQQQQQPQPELQQQPHHRSKVKVIKSKRPLCHFKFYLDICDHQLTKRIEADIKALGGTLEFFLNDSITHFITDKEKISSLETAEASRNTCTQPGTPLAPSTPQTPTTPIATNHADGNSLQRRSRQTRADAILSRVRPTTPIATGSIAVQQQTRDTNKQNKLSSATYTIWQTEYALRFFQRIQTELRQYLNSSAPGTLGGSQAGGSANIQLKGNFIKIESIKRNHRPYYHLLKQPEEWPKINLSSEDSAFRLQTKAHVQSMTRKSLGSRSSQRQQDKDPQQPPQLQHAVVQALKKQSAAVRTPDSPRSHCRELKESTDKPCGVCEICKIEYDTLTVHLQSKEHELFAKNDENFLALDTLIRESASVNGFLEREQQQQQQYLQNQKKEQTGEIYSNSDMEIDEHLGNSFNAHSTKATNQTNSNAADQSSSNNNNNNNRQRPSPALREKSKRITKGKHSSEKFRASLDASPNPQTPKKMTTPCSLQELQRVEQTASNATTAAATPTNPTRRKTQNSVLSPPIRAMLPPSSLYKVVEASDAVATSPRVRRGAANANANNVMDSPSLIVKFQKVRQSELQRLNGEAENFMFPRTTTRSSSELLTDVDRQTTSDPRGHHSISSASLDSSSEVDVPDSPSKITPVKLQRRATAAGRRRKGTTTAATPSSHIQNAFPHLHRQLSTGSSSSNGGGGQQQRFPIAPIQPEVQPQLLRQRLTATRKSSRMATAIVTAATTSSQLQIRRRTESALICRQGGTLEDRVGEQTTTKKTPNIDQEESDELEDDESNDESSSSGSDEDYVANGKLAKSMPTLSRLDTREERAARRLSRLTISINHTAGEKHRPFEPPTLEKKSHTQRCGRTRKRAIVKSKQCKQQMTPPTTIKKPLETELIFDCSKSERLQKLRYAFEESPEADLWHRVFQRQDLGEEHYYSYYGSTRYRKLPYELGPIPMEQTNSHFCTLCRRQQQQKPCDTELNQTLHSIKLERNRDLETEQADSNQTAATVTSTTTSSIYKHKKMHLLQRYQQEQQQQQQQHQQTLNTAIPIAKCDSKASTPELLEREFASLTENAQIVELVRAASTQSNSSSSCSNSQKSSGTCRNKQLARIAELPPRKSPREHASTLALVSCIIRQRQDSQSKTNSEADEPSATPANSTAPTLKTPFKQEQQESIASTSATHNTRSQAATPVEELRFATEISETVKRMRRGQNKYNTLPPTLVSAPVQAPTPARCRRPTAAAAAASYSRHLELAGKPVSRNVLLSKRKCRQIAATPVMRLPQHQPPGMALAPGVRKLSNKKGLLEYEMDSNALKALEANIQYVNPLLISWQIDKYLELTGREYDISAEEQLPLPQPAARNSEDADFWFTSEFDLCDLLAESAGSGDDEELSAVRSGCRRNSKMNLYCSYQRKRKCLKSNRTGWPRAQRRRATVIANAKLQPVERLRMDVGKSVHTPKLHDLKQEPFETEEEQTTATTTTTTTTTTDKEIGKEQPDGNGDDSSDGAGGDGGTVDKEKATRPDTVMTPPGTDVDEEAGSGDESVEEAAAGADNESQADDEDDLTMADSIDQDHRDGEVGIEASDADVEEDDGDDDDDDDVYEDAYGEEHAKHAPETEQNHSQPYCDEPPEKRVCKISDLSVKKSNENYSSEKKPLLTVQTSNGYRHNATSTPTTQQARQQQQRRTPQLNGSLGSCISPSEKLGDNSDIFTVSSDGLDTDMDLSNTQAGDSMDHCTHQQLHQTTPKRKFDISKYAPPNNAKAASSCAAEAATAAVKSLAISQFLKKEVRVTCRRLRAPFRRFRYRR